MVLCVLGCGFVGAPLLARAASTIAASPRDERRWQRVRAVSRSGAPRGGEPATADPSEETGEQDAASRLFEARALDLLACSEIDLRSALHGVTSLVCAYAAGRLQDRRALYVDGGRRVARAAVASGVAHVVYCSSTSALPDADDLLNEEVLGRPNSERGEVQRRAEEVWTEELGRAEVPCTILRLAGLYGPGRPLANLYLRAPNATIEGDAWSYTNLVHRDDAVEAIMRALSRLPPHRGILHISDGDLTPRRTMIEQIAAAQHLSRPRFEAAHDSDTPPRGKRVDAARSVEILGMQYRSRHASSR